MKLKTISQAVSATVASIALAGCFSNCCDNNNPTPVDDVNFTTVVGLPSITGENNELLWTGAVGNPAQATFAVGAANAPITISGMVLNDLVPSSIKQKLYTTEFGGEVGPNKNCYNPTATPVGATLTAGQVCYVSYLLSDGVNGDLITGKVTADTNLGPRTLPLSATVVTVVGQNDIRLPFGTATGLIIAPEYTTTVTFTNSGDTAISGLVLNIPDWLSALIDCSNLAQNPVVLTLASVAAGQSAEFKFTLKGGDATKAALSTHLAKLNDNYSLPVALPYDSADRTDKADIVITASNLRHGGIAPAVVATTDPLIATPVTINGTGPEHRQIMTVTNISSIEALSITAIAESLPNGVFNLGTGPVAVV